MSGNLGTIYYEVDARTGKLLTAGKQADDAFDRIERGAMKADSGVKKLNTQLTKTSAAVKTNLSPAIRNASYQIADLATQLQMGGNALQAFAVQGAQLLAGFGTMGAVAGAVLAIAGAMGGGVTINSPITINTTNGFSDEDSRRLEEAMKRVAMGVCRQESTRPGGMLAPRRR